MEISHVNSNCMNIEHAHMYRNQFSTYRKPTQWIECISRNVQERRKQIASRVRERERCLPLQPFQPKSLNIISKHCIGNGIAFIFWADIHFRASTSIYCEKLSREDNCRSLYHLKPFIHLVENWAANTRDRENNKETDTIVHSASTRHRKCFCVVWNRHSKATLFYCFHTVVALLFVHDLSNFRKIFQSHYTHHTNRQMEKVEE